MVLLDVLGYMGHIVCEIDTRRNNTRNIPKDDFEAFFTHFRGIKQASGKHQQIRIVQVRLISYIRRQRDVLGGADGCTTLGWLLAYE